MRTRDRHGRGVRGPLATPNSYTGRAVPIPQAPRGTRMFLSCVQSAIARVAKHAPDVIDSVDIGVDEVPDSHSLWQSNEASDAIPLASTTDAHDGAHARIVLFRRPLEHRAGSRLQLTNLIHETLVDKLVTLTGRSIDDIDPDDGLD